MLQGEGGSLRGFFPGGVSGTGRGESATASDRTCVGESAGGEGSIGMGHCFRLRLGRPIWKYVTFGFGVGRRLRWSATVISAAG